MPPSQPAEAAAARLAAPSDAPEVARLLYDFQLEFSEPTPEVEALAERYRELIGAGEMTVLLIGDGPDGFAQLRFRPWVYSPGSRAHAYLEELYVVPARRGRGLGRALLEAAMATARNGGQPRWSSGLPRTTLPRASSMRAPASPTARAVRTAR